MALNIKNEEVERLAAEVAIMARETKTEAVRRALLERRDRLALRVRPENRGARLRRFVESEVWPLVPASELGQRWSREKEEALLGYGKDGV
jgi:antitoxin VapB